MAPRDVLYYFGRFNIMAVYSDKRTYVLEGLLSQHRQESRNSEWGFFEIDELTVDDDQYITGYLVKYKTQTEEEVVVPETSQIEDEAVNNRVIAKSRFFLHIRSGLIAYRVIGGQISDNQFRKFFASLFREGHDNLFVNAEVISVDEDYELLEMFGRFDRIFLVSVSLHPSNPSFRDRWKNFDNRLKELEAGSYEEKIEAKGEQGLNIQNDEETLSKISMAHDGYGDATVGGIIDGERKKINTKSNPITTLAPAVDTNDPPNEDTMRALRILLFTFNKIRSRFNDEH